MSFSVYPIIAQLGCAIISIAQFSRQLCDRTFAPFGLENGNSRIAFRSKKHIASTLVCITKCSIFYIQR